MLDMTFQQMGLRRKRTSIRLNKAMSVREQSCASAKKEQILQPSQPNAQFLHISIFQELRVPLKLRIVIKGMNSIGVCSLSSNSDVEPNNY
jgi:hypothetical protein